MQMLRRPASASGAIENVAGARADSDADMPAGMPDTSEIERSEAERDSDTDMEARASEVDNENDARIR